MHDAIAGRELIVLDGLGIRLQGTCHLTAESASHSTAGPANREPVGVLFLNSLSLPRAASGDSAVRWAEAIAQRGYPAFRVDLPGLGDSQGTASTDLLDLINDGAFTSVIGAVSKQLVDRFNLSGVILVGHCAGSVSALYAGAATPECKGLILLDPYFHLPQATRPKVRQELSQWARRSSVGKHLSDVYDHARKLVLLMRGSAPPGNANTQLLTCWKQVAAAGMPILLLKAPGIKAQGNKPRVGEFDYIQYTLKLAGRKNRVSVRFIEDADHSFANRLGRAAVEHQLADWLATYFPLPNLARALGNESVAHSGGDQVNSATEHHSTYCAIEGR